MYGNQHKIIAQFFLSKSLLSFEEFSEIFKKVLEECSIEIDSNNSEDFKTTIKAYISTINQKLRKRKFEIIKVHDENLSEKKDFYTLVTLFENDNTMKGAMARYNELSLEYFRLIIKAIIESDEKRINSINATNLTKKVKTRSLTQTEGDKHLNKFCKDGWLRKEGGNITFTPKFIGEMKGYIQCYFPSYANECKHCRKFVLKAYRCRCKDIKLFHKYCKNKCSKCKDQSGTRKRKVDE